MRSILRPHQSDAITRLRQSLASGKRRPVIQAPTGFGKTVIAAAVTEMALEKGRRVVFCAPAVSLIDQTVERFYSEGITDIGVIQANHPMTDWSKPVQVASVQTLERRGYPEADLVMVDECHRMFKFMNKWMGDPAWAKVPFVGLSATPWAKGMGKIYDDLIIASTTDDLIKSGYLSPFKVFAPVHPDLSDVRVVAGDYHEGDLAEAMNKPKIVADLVQTWGRLGEDRPTIAFCVDRAHAQSVQADFNACGVRCEYIDAFTDLNERANIKRRFEAGETKVVSSVGCLTTGIDWDIRCIVMARPTRSEMLFVQMVGRGLRTADGKQDLIILDHADNHARLGFVTDITHTELNNGAKGYNSYRSERRKSLPCECSKCTFLMPVGVKQCPSCGTPRALHSEVAALDGELSEWRRGEKKARRNAKDYSREEKQKFYSGLLHIAAEKGYKSGWAAHKYNEKFKEWPRCMYDVPAQPTAEVYGFVRSRQIAWSRSKKSEAAKGGVNAA